MSAATGDSLNDTLAGEHAAVWILGVLGGQVSDSAEPRLSAAISRSYRTHRARRDQLIARVTDLGDDPVASEVGYALPDLNGSGALRNEARRLENACAALYADQVAHTSGSDREWAITALVDSAVRVLDFNGKPVTWPGAQDLAD